jgi:CRISPR-associated protein, Cmr5 family
MRTLGQKRAEFALEKVLAIPEGKKKDFKTFSAGAPSMILQNGFGQALAFWLSKGTDKELNIKKDDKHIVLFDMIWKWLPYEKDDVENRFVEKDKAKTRTDLIRQLSGMNQSKYLTAQKETLALLEWVKRYANADL